MKPENIINEGEKRIRIPNKKYSVKKKYKLYYI